jgi:hypothetical protein
MKIFLMYQSTQQFYNKQITTTVLAFVYCAEVLLHVLTLSGHHQSLHEYVTCYWIVYQYGSRSVIYHFFSFSVCVIILLLNFKL